MNRGRDRLRVLLLGAVAAGVFGPQQFVHAAGPGPVPAPSNSKKPAAVAAKPGVPTAPPRLLPTSDSESSAIRPVSQSDAAAPATPGTKSEVMRQLELLYQQDGREMPDLNTDIRPVPTAPNAGGAAAKGPSTPVATQVPVAAPAAPAAPNALRTQQPPTAQKMPIAQPPGGLRTQQPPTVQKTTSTAPAAAPAKSKYPVVSYFKKLMPGGKTDPKPTSAPSNYRPDVPPVPPAIVSQPPAQLRRDPLISTSASSSNVSLPLLDSQPRVPVVAVGGTPKGPGPVVNIGEIPLTTTTSLPQRAVQASELPPLGTDTKSPVTSAPANLPQAPASTDAADPFTEMSEADADQKLELNPFTGLTLDADAGSANAPSAASAKPPTTEAPSPTTPTADDPFADELKKMGIVPPVSAETESPKLTPPTEPSKLTPPTEPSKLTPPLTEPPQLTPPPTESLELPPAPTEIPKFTPPTVESPKVTPPKWAPTRTEPPKLTPPATDSPKVTPTTVEPPKLTVPTTESPKVLPPKLTPPRTEPPKLTLPTEPPSFEGIEDQTTREKMKKIHERGTMKGLKGFCPVTLRDQRELVDAKSEFHSTFRGQKFHFANGDAKLKFDEEPARYAPVAYGADVVSLTRDKDVVEGTLEFAAWFKGRLYLFGVQETHDTFVGDPSKYATPVGIE